MSASYKIIQLLISDATLVEAAISLAVESFQGDPNTPTNPHVAHCIHSLRIRSCLDIGTVWAAISDEGCVDSIACTLSAGTVITQAPYYRQRLKSCLGLAHICLGDKDDISEPSGWTNASLIALSGTRYERREWRDLDRLILLATRPTHQRTYHLATRLLEKCKSAAEGRSTGIGLFTQDEGNVAFYGARGFREIASLKGVKAMIMEID